MPKPSASPVRKVSFEVHTYNGEYWLPTASAADFEQALAAAENDRFDPQSRAARVVRRTDYPDYGCHVHTVLQRWANPGVVDDLSAPFIASVDTLIPCTAPEHFYADRARETIATILARWLDEQRVTPLELLHGEVHARRLNDSGTALQGALQKVAIAQVRNSEITVQQRYRDLLALIDDALNALHAERKQNEAPVPAPGQWKRISGDLLDRHGPENLRFQQLRSLSHYLASASNWLEKLNLLGALVEPDLPERDIAPIDAIAGEILTNPTAAMELVGGPKTSRQAQISALLLLSLGKPIPGLDAVKYSGIMALGGLAAADKAPRICMAVRQRTLSELASTAPLVRENGLMHFVQALQQLSALIASAPTLTDDVELKDVLELKANRAVNPDSVHATLGSIRSTSERFRAMLKLADSMPYAASKTKLLEFTKGVATVEDLIREAGGRLGERAAAFGPLAEFSRMISKLGIPDEAKTSFLEPLDTALFDIIRTEVLGAQGRSYFDRVVTLIKMCGASPLPEGRAKALATEIVSRAVSSQEFLTPFLARFKTDADKKQALSSLRDLLLASGLGRSSAQTAPPAGSGR